MMRAVDVSSLTPPVADLAPGPPPLLDWVRVDRMVVDDRYQRPLGVANLNIIRRIAAEFCWAQFSPVLLAPIEGGLFAIVDGQHRVHAAALRGIDRVPAMITVMDMPAQAQAFAAVNGQLTRVTRLQVYRAALAAGADWAVACDAAVSAAGCRMMAYHASASAKLSGQVYTTVLIRKHVEADEAWAVTAALRALRAFDTTGRVALWSAHIMQPWIMAVALDPDRRKFDPDVLHEKLLSVLRMRDPFKVVDAGEAVPGRDSVSTKASGVFAAMIRAVQNVGAV